MNQGKAMGAFRYLLMTLVAALLLGAPAQGANNIAASLVPETRTVAPGQTVTLALVMRPSQGWHGYWKNPGDSGIETSITWTLPNGVTAGPIQYPVPDRLTISGLMNYVYEGAYAQLIDVAVPAGVASGTRLPLRGRVDYLACTDQICVPESAQIATELEVGSGGARDPAFDGYRSALPKPLDRPGTFQVAGDRFRLAVPVAAGMQVSEAYFFPLTDGALAYAAPQRVTRSGNSLIVETEAGGQAGSLGAIEGVLEVGEDQGLMLTARPGAVPAGGAALAPAVEESGDERSTFLLALLGAVAGGLLLNVMPCVFPILSLKALSLAKAGGGESEVRREALAYTAGAVLLCLALGGALLAIRAGGSAAGWAFQLQDPRVILLLLLLVTAIALNLAGLFELPNLGIGQRLTRSKGVSGAFWTGGLAAFVATPCTGPFMGAALGAALILPAPAALAVFAGLGLGLALPFLLLGFVPALRRRLPRPGPWMDRFRRLMSIPMFLTALGLAWILGRQSGVDGMALGLAAALILSLALWWMGRGPRSAWVPLAPAALATVAALLLVPTATDPAVAAPAGELQSQPFSESKLSELRGESRPVFVYFTADWCVTCKVNEKAALERDEVARAFAKRKVAVLVGDWTRGDAAISRFLAKHGRSGVPLYLYYAPGKDVQVLPQILTPGRLTSMVS
jgi:thiol:disulfide interchange protein/DsbC/DsbD-like thiol-disulfide interchange protein